jgi:hypothetical protein
VSRFPEQKDVFDEQPGGGVDGEQADEAVDPAAGTSV